jgi:prevent-host-death family protein
MKERAPSVGVRELRNGLSSYLRRVRRGETMLVTDRGRPVARIVPPDMPERLMRAIREGRVIPPNRPWSGPPRAVIPYRKGSKLLSDLVIEQRRK